MGTDRGEAKQPREEEALAERTQPSPPTPNHKHERQTDGRVTQP